MSEILSASVLLWFIKRPLVMSSVEVYFDVECKYAALFVKRSLVKPSLFLVYLFCYLI